MRSGRSYVEIMVGPVPNVEATATDFSSFYEREVVGQVRSATLIVGSQELAQEVVHDAFVSILRSWGEIDQPGPYLQRSVVNGCRDMLRRRNVAHRYLRSRAVAVEVSTGPVDAPLFDALSRLPWKHRAAVVLRYYLQLSETEIAEHLDCRPGSVGPWIRRGLDQLASELTS